MKIKYSYFGVVFTVSSIDRTQQFFRTILGIELERQSGGDEGDWLFARLKNGVELIFFKGGSIHREVSGDRF